jgi:hypothetical protein
MAKPPTKVPASKIPPSKIPPRSKSGGATRPGARPVPPRPPRNPSPRRRRGGRSPGRFYAVLGGVAIIAAVVLVVVILSSSGGGSTTASAKQPAVNFKTTAGTKVYGTLGPEGVPIEIGTQLAPPNTGLTGAPIDGLQCNSTEQLTYHHHAHLAIFINGQLRTIPLGVGMVAPAQVEQTSSGDFATGATCFYWMHVHAYDGVLHIESPTPKVYELQQFFDIWHVALSSDQIGSYKGHVTATVDGKPWTGDPGQIPLNEHTQVVLNLGGPIVTPPPISWTGTQL